MVKKIVIIVGVLTAVFVAALFVDSRSSLEENGGLRVQQTHEPRWSKPSSRVQTKKTVNNLTSVGHGESRPTAPAPKTASRLVIPVLGVDRPVVDTALVKDTSSENSLMQVPPFDQVGRLSISAPLAKSKKGSTLLAGHVSTSEGAGVFSDLDRILPGSQVWTTDSRGRATEWVITSIRPINKFELPSKLYSTSGKRQLVLVTCSGRIVQTQVNGKNENHYDNNLVVVAVPVVKAGKN